MTPAPPGRCFTCGAALTWLTWLPGIGGWTCPSASCPAYYRLVEVKQLTETKAQPEAMQP